MKYLVDTNVVSELQKIQYNPFVIGRLESLTHEDIFVSSISIGEITYGIERLADSRKKQALTADFWNKIVPWFENRIISLDFSVVLIWGALRARHTRTLPLLDSLLAATCLTFDLTLLTRNVKDFEDIAGIKLSNPWETNGG